MNYHKLKIALVGGLNTPIASGLAYGTSFSSLLDLLQKRYDVVFFRYKGRFASTSIRKTYIHLSFTWLSRLFLYLVKGRFRLFIVGMFSSETMVTFIVSRLMRRPFIVLDEHWYWRENLLMRLLWPVARLIACNATFLIVPGIRAKKFWDFVGIPKRKVRVVNFDASILEPEEKHVKLSSKIRSVLNNKKIILYFGRLVKRKGVDFLIRAFAKLSKDDKDVVLLIAGEGVERGNLQRLCKELGLDGRVYFMGFANQDDKAAYFLACDIFVCPSITLGMPEIWGIVVDEAISLGKPVVVTTAVGSAYDLVRHGVNGYIVPEKNVDALCKAIKLILSDKNLRISMGKASKKLSEKITYRAFRSLDESIKSALLRTVPYMQ